MEYNTQQRKLPLPEYGRSVQNMVDHALTIEDREERQRCANTIVNIMGGMFPQLRDMEDFRHKLWDHLAIMSDFKLDIDYPVEIVKKESLEVKPDRIPYSPNVIRFRHYGRFIQDLIKIAVDYPEGDEKKQLIYRQPHEEGLHQLQQGRGGRPENLGGFVRAVRRTYQADDG